MQTILQSPVGWIARTGDQIDRIRINALSCEVVDGLPVWVKRRTWLSHFLVPVANAFFWLADNPVEVLATNATWQRQEMDTFRRLNGEDRRVGALLGNAIYLEILPGSDLVRLLKERHLNSDIMRSVGMAFRTMHQTLNPITGELFSHGDPHLGNVIYDFTSESVNWVDFETSHRTGLATVIRHADDLLVFLLDLVGRSTEAQWQTLSPVFLEAYAQNRVVAELKRHLVLPAGLGAVWWAVRTSYLDREELRLRMDWLRERL